jgi:hypothetical protein
VDWHKTKLPVDLFFDIAFIGVGESRIRNEKNYMHEWRWKKDGFDLNFWLGFGSVWLYHIVFRTRYHFSGLDCFSFFFPFLGSRIILPSWLSSWMYYQSYLYVRIRGILFSVPLYLYEEK